MPGYYIPQKNRCYISCTPGYQFPFYICKPTSSNINTINKASTEVAKNYEDKEFNNSIKRGSGGNSYQAYLLKKRGQRIINQCKNGTCWESCNPNKSN